MGLIEGFRTMFTHLDQTEALQIVKAGKKGITDDVLDRYERDHFLDLVGALGMGSVGNTTSIEQREATAALLIARASRDSKVDGLMNAAVHRASPFSLIPPLLQRPTPPEGQHTKIIPPIKLFGYR